MIPTTTDPQVQRYLDEVRAALGDLPPDERDELLEDLSDHLATVLAEDAGSLRDRLGEPAAYASELRAAAGMGAAAPRGPRRDRDWWRERWGRVDRRVGTTLGHDALTEWLRTLRPGWWVLRGLLVGALLLAAAEVRPEGPGLLFALLVMLALVAVSVRLGVAMRGVRGWAQWVTGLGSFVLVVIALGVFDPSRLWTVPSPASTVIYNNPVEEVYPYDADGRPLQGVRLFDQNGMPINIGITGRCQAELTRPLDVLSWLRLNDGSAVMYGGGPQDLPAASYPMCPPGGWVPGEAPSPSPPPSPSPSPSPSPGG
jgi:hypothetical protein